MSNDNLEQITEATSKGDYKSIGKLVRKASRQGTSREDIIQALSAGLSDVSKKYKVKGIEAFLTTLGVFKLK